MTWLTGYDAVPEGVGALPAGGWYAGYIDGFYISYEMIRRRFPAAIVLPISVWGGVEPILPALILDVEKGNPTPPQGVPHWLNVQQLHGYPLHELGVYADASTWPAIDAALRDHGYDPYSIKRWVADWTHRPHLPAGFHCCQWTDHPDRHNLYDENVCIPEFLSLPTPTPIDTTEDDMIHAVVNQDGRLEVFVEKHDSGEVFHTYQTKEGPWAGAQEHVRNAAWYSLGIPGK